MKILNRIKCTILIYYEQKKVGITITPTFLLLKFFTIPALY